MHFFENLINYNKNETELKIENPTQSFREMKNCDELELAKEKRGHFLYRLFSPKGVFLTFLFYLNV